MIDKLPNDITPEQAASALAWLVEMGADEIIADAAIDRFAASVVVGTFLQFMA